jgi:uncharacterized protein YbjT (DUF2867 family)
MEVLVAGGHGQIALRLLKLLADRGHRGRGLIRNPDHAADLVAVGADPVLCDLESDDPRPHVGSAQAIVFAAGAGPGSGPERKRTVDLGGAVKLIEAAKQNGISRYVIVSSMGADDPPSGDQVFAVYLQAKAAADQALRESGLEFTIVRPGRLTNDRGTGRIEAAESLGRRGEIPRDDVAATLVAVLDEPATVGKTFEVLGGEEEIAAALRTL